jgi:hypothetical protein
MPKIDPGTDVEGVKGYDELGLDVMEGLGDL